MSKVLCLTIQLWKWGSLLLVYFNREYYKHEILHAHNNDIILYYNAFSKGGIVVKLRI